MEGLWCDSILWATKKALSRVYVPKGKKSLRTFNLSVKIHRNRGKSVIPISFWSALVYSEEKKEKNYLI